MKNWLGSEAEDSKIFDLVQEGVKTSNFMENALDITTNKLLTRLVLPYLIKNVFVKYINEKITFKILNRIFGSGKITDIEAVKRLKEYLERTFEVQLQWELTYAQVFQTFFDANLQTALVQLGKIYIPQNLATSVTRANYGTFFSRTLQVLGKVKETNPEKLLDLQFLILNISPTIDYLLPGDVIYDVNGKPQFKVDEQRRTIDLESGESIDLFTYMDQSAVPFLYLNTKD
jgi:hypothetical protein